MQVANRDTVLGDFGDARFDYNGITSRFFRRNSEYWVSTDGPNGSIEEFRVTHTFGVDPLQQYLIEFPGGRRQALSIAWDTRPVVDGGQRWFHLYPDDVITSDDPLHWTGTFQNWNTMCAACHSTNLAKNYDAAGDAFATAWSAINVECESCHGPGSAHVESPGGGELALRRQNRSWAFIGDAATARLQTQAENGREIEVCAQCHSRRSQLTEAHDPGEPLLDAFRPVILDSGLYHADGQILDEVYVYGSFLQSAMYAAGVTCSDCHEPHSVETKAVGNALCGQCHLAGTFDGPEHHRHARGTPGAECVNCHMRAETYMVVDPRRDHSFRIPRPDLTAALGTPNACADCHSDRTPDWAAAQIAEWYPDGHRGEFHFGEALHAGRNWSLRRTELLRRVIEDRSQPEIARASAVSLIANPLDDVALDVIERQLNGEDALVQLAALDALAGAPLPLRAELGQRFLTHEFRALRLAAARALLPARDVLSEGRRADLDAAMEEYLETQKLNSDRGEGLLNQADVLVEQRRFAEAEPIYLAAIAREPAIAATYVNLADLYRQTGRELEGQAILREGIDAVAEDPGLNLALGLSLVRTGALDEAIETIAQAAELGAEDPYYHYVLGVALNSSGESNRAIAVLESAHERFPAYRDILVGLATILRDRGELERAAVYAGELLALAPSDETARALVAELEAAR
jgi:tetratricopeptide (TPR) repeat protein